MINFKRMDSEDIACLLAIIIGGIYAIVNPDKLSESMETTILAIILIKIFW